MKPLISLLLFCAALTSVAEVVHVYERASTGELLADRTLDTGRSYLTQAALAKSGYIFTHWTISTAQTFSPRDDWGRAYDSAPFTLYEETTLTANYLPTSQDTDGDGLADGHEIYWYGNLSNGAASDTDNDGKTFAQEIAAGTNPLFSDRHEEGPVAYADGALLQYNPYNLQPYTFRSEPEGALFATVSDYARAGSQITFAKPSGNFAYWRSNGVELRDAWGRAVDSIAMTMPTNAVEIVAVAESDYNARMSLYWYGRPDVSAQADTDNDGNTFAEEIAAGTNPLFPERHEEGPVAYADTEAHEMNLQPYEQVQGAVVDGAYSQVFTSPVAGNAATSATFGNGGAVWPVVADVNGDGLWDLVVCWDGGVKVFVNVGTKGNPEFEVDASGALAANADLEANSVAKLAALSLDVAAPGDALSATTNGTALLVSDSEGRIWYFKGNGDGFTLQHKVWGGSFADFAQGLRLAAVDWEDDGDLDCLAGTADGKLMLLRDPRVGIPTNVKALAGGDNILLTWDPNQQSRIRGYRLYRAPADVDDFARIAQPQLPTYRDFPDEGGAFDYKVSSVSRFYTAGNSTPTETESMPTDAVRAELGKVKFFWNDVAVKLGEQAAVMLSIENSMNYNVAGKSQTVTYDPDYLTPFKVVKSGLTEACDVQCVVVNDGEWQITFAGGTLAAGGGKFLTLVFDTVKAGTTTVGEATVDIVDMPNDDPTDVPPYSLGDVNGDGRVDVEDVRLLAKLKNGNGRKPTENQLKAGDFNGNGKLDNADYQALRALLKEKGAL